MDTLHVELLALVLRKVPKGHRHPVRFVCKLWKLLMPVCKAGKYHYPTFHNSKMLKWAASNGYKVNHSDLRSYAKDGNLHMIELSLKVGCASFDFISMFTAAAKHNRLNVLEWCHNMNIRPRAIPPHVYSRCDYKTYKLLKKDGFNTPFNTVSRAIVEGNNMILLTPLLEALCDPYPEGGELARVCAQAFKKGNYEMAIYIIRKYSGCRYIDADERPLILEKALKTCSTEQLDDLYNLFDGRVKYGTYLDKVVARGPLTSLQWLISTYFENDPANIHHMVAIYHNLVASNYAPPAASSYYDVVRWLREKKYI